MKPATIDLVRASWKKVKPRAPHIAALFYHNLFAADPRLKELFKGDMAAQRHRLMRMIDLAVDRLEAPHELGPVLHDLAQRHVGYGVQAALCHGGSGTTHHTASGPGGGLYAGRARGVGRGVRRHGGNHERRDTIPRLTAHTFPKMPAIFHQNARHMSGFLATVSVHSCVSIRQVCQATGVALIRRHGRSALSGRDQARPTGQRQGRQDTRAWAPEKVMTITGGMAYAGEMAG